MIQPNKNEWYLTVVYHILNTTVSSIKAPPTHYYWNHWFHTIISWKIFSFYRFGKYVSFSAYFSNFSASLPGYPYISTTPPTHTIFASNHTQLSPGSWEWHYIDDIFSEEIYLTHSKHTNIIDEAAPKKGWLITPPIVQSPTISVKFLGITWSVQCCPIPDTVKKQRLTLAEPSALKQAQHHLGLFSFWKQYIPHLQTLLKCISTVTLKLVYFKWSLQ